MEFISRLIQGEPVVQDLSMMSNLNAPENRGTEDSMTFFRIAA